MTSFFDIQDPVPNRKRLEIKYGEPLAHITLMSAGSFASEYCSKCNSNLDEYLEKNRPTLEDMNKTLASLERQLKCMKEGIPFDEEEPERVERCPKCHIRLEGYSTVYL